MIDKKKSLYLYKIFVVLIFMATLVHGVNIELSVGIFQNKPIVYKDDTGEPAGLYVELLNEIARQENWEITYHFDTWSNSLTKLARGDLDLMTSITVTEERHKTMDFSCENILIMWGQLYVHSNAGIGNITDLEGKRIAVLKNEINAINFIELCEQFGINVEIFETDSYEKIFKMTESGDVHAGVVNNILGYELESEYRVDRSAIMFSPFKLLFAVPENQHQDIIDIIDSYIKEWRLDKSSFYYSAIDKTISKSHTSHIPQWIFIVIGTIVLLLSLAVVMVALLRWKVNTKTRELCTSEERFRQIFENAPLGLIHFDNTGSVTLFNSKIVEELGIPADVLMGIDPLKELSDDRMKEALKNALNGKRIRYEGPFEPDENSGISELSSFLGPIFDDKKRVTGVIGIIEDITEKKKAEADRIKLERQLRQIQKIDAIGTLAGGIANDFNAILTTIIGYSELLSGNIDKESDESGYVNEVLKASLKAKDLVEQILLFSSEGERDLKPVQIIKSINEVVHLLEPGLDSNIEVYQSLPKECPEILADPVQVRQIILNVCTNSYQAMKEYGGIISITLNEIEIGTREKLHFEIHCQSGTYLELKVSDTGEGMDKDVLEKVFNPYFSTKKEGAGLGLSVVLGIIKSYGGDISITSTPDNGTEVRLFFPIEKSDTMKVAQNKKNSSEMSTESGAERILLIDDDKIILKMLYKSLDSLGYVVTPVSDGTEALELVHASQEEFDLIISDISMPGLTGLDLMELLKKEHCAIPVILCTGYGESSIKNRALELGVKGFLQKPILRSDLSVLVRESLL